MHMLRVVIESVSSICNSAPVMQCHTIRCVTLRQAATTQGKQAPLTYYAYALAQVMIIRCGSL